MSRIYDPKQTYADYFREGIPFIFEGLVVSTADPDQMGRAKIWVPALDGESFEVTQLPWATYASPFMGFTVDYPAGEGTMENKAHTAYGFWAIPKVGASVLVFCLNGSATARCYFASTPRLHRNRSLPAGRNMDFNGNPGPFGDAGDGKGNLEPIQPAFDNLRIQFQGNITASEAITRGAYERNVAQAKKKKDGTEGYSPNQVDPDYLDPQTYCMVTPGRHAIIMQDDPQFARLRIKTAEGHQVIFDDANERIYVSTSFGNSWFEMDKDGHVHVYGSKSISLRAGKDINMFADGNINMEADKGVNIRANNNDVRISAQTNVQVKANKSILMSACDIFDMSSETTLKLTSQSSMDILSKASMKMSAANKLDIKAGGKGTIQTNGMDLNGGESIKASAGRIDLNGPEAAAAEEAKEASCPEAAESPSIVPGFEPWTRPESDLTRNPNWKP